MFIRRGGRGLPEAAGLADQAFFQHSFAIDQGHRNRHARRRHGFLETAAPNFKDGRHAVLG